MTQVVSQSAGKKHSTITAQALHQKPSQREDEFPARPSPEAQGEISSEIVVELQDIEKRHAKTDPDYIASVENILTRQDLSHLERTFVLQLLNDSLTTDTAPELSRIAREQFDQSLTQLNRTDPDEEGATLRGFLLQTSYLAINASMDPKRTFRDLAEIAQDPRFEVSLQMRLKHGPPDLAVEF